MVKNFSWSWFGVQGNRRFILYFCLAALLFFGGLAAFLVAGEESLVVVSDLMLPLYNALAAAALFCGYLHARRENRSDRFAWLLIAISQLVYTTADGLWTYFELVLGQEPFPSAVDVFYLLWYPIFGAGILLFPFEKNKPRENRKFALEMLIVMITAGLYLWNFVIEPLVAEYGAGDQLALLFSMAYPLMDMLILLVLTFLLYRRTKAAHPYSITILVLGVILTLLADIFFSVANLEGTYLAGRVLDFFYPASNLLFGLAGIVSMMPFTPRPERSELNGRVGLHRHLTALMLAAAFILLIFGFYQELAIGFWELVLWVGGVVLLTIIVQLIDAWDISELNRDLHQLNVDLEQRVEQRTLELANSNQNLREEVNLRLQIANELQVSETLYRAVVEDLPVFICRFRKDGTLTFVNQAYCNYFIHQREELIGQSFFMLIPEGDRDFVRERFESLTVERPMVSYEHRVIAGQGEIRWQRWIDRAIFENGELVEFQSIGEDITEKRMAEQALRESEERFRDLFDNSTNLIQIVSPDWKFVFVNKAWRAQLGYSESDINGLVAWDVLGARERGRWCGMPSSAL